MSTAVIADRHVTTVRFDLVGVTAFIDDVGKAYPDGHAPFGGRVRCRGFNNPRHPVAEICQPSHAVIHCT